MLNMSEERAISLQTLFDSRRLGSQRNLVPLILYFPIGLVLFVIRIFIMLHAFLVAALLPKSSQTRCTVLRSMCAILGIVVREEDLQLKSKGNIKLLISNHVTPLDFLAVDLVFPCIYPILCEIPKFLTRSLALYDFGASESREVFLQNLKRYCSSPSPLPLLIHPEGATTNGKRGLLKFNSWPFSFDNAVQPVCISVSRPVLSVSPSIIASTWWSDLFWTLLTPCTIFTLRYVRPMKRSENESLEAWVKRVQLEMAQTLNVEATNYTDADKAEHIKRMSHINRSSPAPASTSRPARQDRPSGAPTTSRSERMALSVKEVLPQVPLHVIIKDLAVTTNVDETITRLLDGTISYQPEPLSPATSKASCEVKETQKEVKKEPFLYDASARTFGKTASERTRSYEERKAALIHNARLRYLKKHPELMKQFLSLQ